MKPEALIAELRDALQGLVDEQNGPPLIRDAKRWATAMSKAHAALVAVTPIPPEPDTLEAVASKACGELPEGYHIELHLERGSGTVELWRNYSAVVAEGPDEETLTECVLRMVEEAREDAASASD